MSEDNSMCFFLDVLSPLFEMPGEGRVGGVSKVIDIIDPSAPVPTIANRPCTASPCPQLTPTY